MKVRHIRSIDVWLLSKGDRVLYRGPASPWTTPSVIAAALRRESLGNRAPVSAQLREVS